MSGRAVVGLVGALVLIVSSTISLVGCGKPPKTAEPPEPNRHAPLPPGPEGGPWTSKLGATHPLVGRVWDVRGKREVFADDLSSAVLRADFVLLGERHDNVDHHRLQARLTATAMNVAPLPVVAWEMFDAEKQPEIDTFLAAHPKDARGLGEAVGWAKTGWPAWETYLPIAEAALARNAPIVAANFSSKLAKGLVFKGPASLPEGSFTRLGLDVPLAPALEASLKEELADAHCGHLPATHTDAMVLAQRARDATLTENLVAGAAKAGGRGVLIAGAGHVRTDRGVGSLLAQKQPGKKIVSVAFVEVADDENDPLAYGPRYHAAALPFDYVWFTPRASDDDPCAAMKPKTPGSSASRADTDGGGQLVVEEPYTPGHFPWPPEGPRRREAIAELAAWNEGGRAPGEKWHPQPRVVIGEPVLGSVAEPKGKSKPKKRNKDGSKTATPAGGAWNTAEAMRALRRYGYAGVRRCFDAALRETPDLEGRTVVDIEVDGAGRIVKSRASAGRAPDPRKHKTSMPSASVRTCIAEALVRVSLPPVARGKRVHARISVDVWPGDVPLPTAEPTPAPGSLPPTAFAAALGPAQPTMRSCFDALEKRHPGTWGRLAFRVDASPEGVVRASQIESTFPDADAVACVTKAIEAVKLPTHALSSRASFALRWRPLAPGGSAPAPVAPPAPEGSPDGSAEEGPRPADSASSAADLR